MAVDAKYQLRMWYYEGKLSFHEYLEALTKIKAKEKDDVKSPQDQIPTHAD